MANTGITSRTTSRVVYRGTNTTFRADFFEDAAKVIPMVPMDPTQWPAYNIIDPNGATAQTGVAAVDGGAGFYKVDWPCPLTCTLSTSEKRWHIEWILVTSNSRQVPFVFEFDVADRVVSTLDSNELEFLALENKPFTVRIPLTVRPHHLALTVSNSNDSTQVVASGTLAGGQIHETVYGDSYAYWLEIPINMLKGDVKYTAVWEIQDTVDSITDHVFQVIRTVSHQLLQYLPDLRTLVDRVQKRLHWVQAYQDSHLINFLMHGMDLVNNHAPYTSWSYRDIPGPVISYWILYSGWWALQSQGLVENDLGFEYSGQETTITYDRRAGIGEALGNMLEYLNGAAGTGGLTNTKTSIVRMQRGVGAYAGRPVRFTAIHNLVYRLKTYSTEDFMGLLVQFGLI